MSYVYYFYVKQSPMPCQLKLQRTRSRFYNSSAFDGAMIPCVMTAAHDVAGMVTVKPFPLKLIFHSCVFHSGVNAIQGLTFHKAVD